MNHNNKTRGILRFLECCKVIVPTVLCTTDNPIVSVLR